LKINYFYIILKIFITNGYYMNIVITGASNGIGYETAKAIGNKGSHHIVAVSRNSSKLDALRKELEESTHSRVTAVPFDLGESDLAPIKATAGELGKIDVLVNNAAILINKPFLDTADDDWHNLFNVNLFGVARLIRALFPQLSAQGGAHIINISSMGGFHGSAKFPGLSAYSASKAALACLTESLAVEFTEYKIAVNCLALGSVQTEMLSKAFPDYKAPIDSTHIAEFISEFALHGNRYFNGKVLPVALTTP